MSLTKEKLLELDKRLAELVKIIKLADKKEYLKKLTEKSQAEDLWRDKDKAQKLMREMADTQDEIELIENLQLSLNQVKELMIEGDKDDYESLASEVKRLEKELLKLEMNKYLSGSYDRSDVILSIHAGQGGVEAMDWTAMLKRMYLRYFEKQGYKVSVIGETLGEEAGIKSVTMTVEGKMVYGYLKREKGAHRLVRQSPFNADNLRQTSFALVDVLPIIEELEEVEIKDDDLEIEFFRSSGSGGQNVNKVSTAVRLKHKPTSVVVECQTQRHQAQNRKMALKLLTAKLWEIEEEKRQAEIKNIKGKHKHATFGNQIRSYVLHPYKQVKDLRTNYLSKDPEAVLDGDLEGFIEAELRLG